ncbi:MAG: hypothetical protein RBG13Loki_1640 [Promethearchaeota archaeon CR_4]|nr:MAG: hypothetical protein RBG13Loki_1640 [Candidatus Lokiarchaeota archaeon CR_4]
MVSFRCYYNGCVKERELSISFFLYDDKDVPALKEKVICNSARRRGKWQESVRTYLFPYYDTFGAVGLGGIIGHITSTFFPVNVTFHPAGLSDLPVILFRNIFILILIALFSFSRLMQDLIVFSNSFFQIYIIVSAIKTVGIISPVFVTIAFAIFENGLIISLVIMARKNKNKIVKVYLPLSILLIAISSTLEVIIL